MSKSRLKNPRVEPKERATEREPVEVLEAEVLPVEPAETGEEGDDLPEVIDLSEDATIEPGDAEPGDAEHGEAEHGDADSFDDARAGLARDTH